MSTTDDSDVHPWATVMVLDPVDASDRETAALFATGNGRVSSDVHVFTRGGEAGAAFERALLACNARDVSPTAWKVHVHTSPDPLRALLDSRPGNVAVVAGRGDTRLAAIAELHAAGLPVLAAPPWLLDAASLPRLRAVTAGPPFVRDLLPARHALLARLRRRIVSSDSLFGELESRDSEGPGVEIGVISHLLRRVRGQLRQRPAWHFDPALRGDGFAIGQPQLIDQAQRLTAVERVRRFADDVSLHRVRRWSTPVALEEYRESTGETDFPAGVAREVSAGVLAMPCNSRIDFSLGGVSARTRMEWRVREPDDGGDLYHAVARGRRAEVRLHQSRSTGYAPQLLYRPRHARELRQLLDEALAAWRDEFPSASTRDAPGGIEVLAGTDNGAGWDARYPAALDDFLVNVERDEWPALEAAQVRLRYRLLSVARDRAEDGVGDASTLD